jgi:predicted metal-dependent enzyme (double-stranded beta helix superfamily)
MVEQYVGEPRHKDDSMSESDWLDHISIDWNDFDSASRISGEIVRHLAADRALLRRMVRKAQQDEHLRPLAEKHFELTYIVLYDGLERGLRIRLHRFTKGLEDIPHNHRFSFSSALLAGSYVHTIFDLERPEDAEPGRPLWTLDQPEGTHEGASVGELATVGLRPALATVQSAGSSYTLHHSTIHKTAMPDETAFSVFCRGPAQKPCALQLQPDSHSYLWKFGRANETSDVLASRRLSDDEYRAFVTMLEEADVI